MALQLLTRTSPQWDNGSPEEDGKSPPLDLPNGCKSPGGHSTYILRIYPNSSTGVFHTLGPDCPGTPGWSPFAHEKERDSRHQLSFCHHKHSGTDLANFYINACFKQGRTQVHHGEQ